MFGVQDPVGWFEVRSAHCFDLFDRCYDVHGLCALLPRAGMESFFAGSGVLPVWERAGLLRASGEDVLILRLLILCSEWNG